MYFKQAHRDNFLPADRHQALIKYIVVHYTSNNGDTGRNNLDYYARTSLKASAHYYVDDTEVCCSVPVSHIAYHCGAKKYKHDSCRNANSIGVEMCSRSRDNKTTFAGYYFTPEVRERTIAFVASLMHDHDIPIERVLRHYDVTGKTCPAPYVLDGHEWLKFKKDVLDKYNGKEEEEKEMDQAVFNKMYAVAKEADEKAIAGKPVSEWAKYMWEKALELGIVDGTRPMSSITRQEVATIAVRLFNLLS